MNITEAEGLHYCQDCDKLTIDLNRESIWYCDYHAKKRGWNIIDGKRVKIISDEKQGDSTTGTSNSPAQDGKS